MSDPIVGLEVSSYLGFEGLLLRSCNQGQTFTETHHVCINHKDKHMTDGKAETGSKIADDLRKGADHVKSDIHDTVNAVNGDLHKMAHQAGGHLREFAGSAEQSVEDTAGSVAKQIRANPIQSTLIALGAGVVLGALFRR